MGAPGMVLSLICATCRVYLLVLWLWGLLLVTFLPQEVYDDWREYQVSWGAVTGRRSRWIGASRAWIFQTSRLQKSRCFCDSRCGALWPPQRYMPSPSSGYPTGGYQPAPSSQRRTEPRLLEQPSSHAFFCVEMCSAVSGDIFISWDSFLIKYSKEELQLISWREVISYRAFLFLPLPPSFEHF